MPDCASVFAHGAVGDGKANETAAIQCTIEAAAATGPGSVVLLPHNGTFRLGGREITKTDWATWSCLYVTWNRPKQDTTKNVS